ncbi:MAG TPA: hypothetical protein VF762_02370 [Blastocatellia bacterium]
MKKILSAILCLCLLSFAGCDELKRLKASAARVPIELQGAIELVETLAPEETGGNRQKVDELLDTLKRVKMAAEKANEKIQPLQKFDAASKAGVAEIAWPVIEGIEELSAEGENFNIKNPERQRQFKATLVIVKAAGQLLKQWLTP